MQTILLEVPKEIAFGLKRNKSEIFFRNSLTGILNLCITHCVMANSPALDKEILSFQIPIALKVRLDKEAKERKMSTSAYISFLLQEGVKHVTLTAEDYEQIALRIRKNQARRDAKKIN